MTLNKEYNQESSRQYQEASESYNNPFNGATIKFKLDSGDYHNPFSREQIQAAEEDSDASFARVMISIKEAKEKAAAFNRITSRLQQQRAKDKAKDQRENHHADHERFHSAFSS